MPLLQTTGQRSGMVGHLGGGKDATPDHSADRGSVSITLCETLSFITVCTFSASPKALDNTIKQESLHPSSTWLQIKLGNLT